MVGLGNVSSRTSGRPPSRHGCSGRRHRNDGDCPERFTRGGRGADDIDHRTVGLELTVAGRNLNLRVVTSFPTPAEASGFARGVTTALRELLAKNKQDLLMRAGIVGFGLLGRATGWENRLLVVAQLPP